MALPLRRSIELDLVSVGVEVVEVGGTIRRCSRRDGDTGGR